VQKSILLHNTYIDVILCTQNACRNLPENACIHFSTNHQCKSEFE